MMKVYRWQGWRSECPPARNGGRQTHEIMAAKSKAAVARAMGVKYPRQLFNLGITENEIDVAVAAAEAGETCIRGWREGNRDGLLSQLDEEEGDYRYEEERDADLDDDDWD